MRLPHSFVELQTEKGQWGASFHHGWAIKSFY